MPNHSSEMRFNRYSLPSFLEAVIDATEKEIVIELVEGEFILDYPLMFLDHDIVIKGAGIGKTVLIIDESEEFFHHEDDAVFNFQGADSQANGFIPINVRIEGLTIQTNISKAEVETPFDENHPENSSWIAHKQSYLIKCYNVKSLIMHNVEILTENLMTTCLDIRRGENIDIRGCVFANYNRRWVGGCVWLRGDLENVCIVDNDFYKYGNDEVIAIWGSNSYFGYNEANEISKKNITISYNRIYCQDTNGGQNTSAIISETVQGRPGNWTGCNQRFIAIYTSQLDNVMKVNNESVARDTPCLYTIDGLHLTNNELFINAPIDYLVTIALDKYTTHKDICIDNNIIKYGNWVITGDLVDFSINYDTAYDYNSDSESYVLFSDEAFKIVGNTIICGQNRYYNKTSNGITYSVDSHTCLELNGVVVHFNKNLIKYTRVDFSLDEGSHPHKGLQLFYTASKGGTVIFNENRCEGLMNLMRGLNNDTTTEHTSVVNLIGKGNYLYGSPRIDYTNIDESHVSLIGNELVCDYQLFLLCEFANSGTVIFEGNRVYRDMNRVTTYTTPKGQMFYTSTNTAQTNITSMKVVCCNNIFENLIYDSSLMYGDFQKVSLIQLKHSNNVFANHVE